MVAQSERRLYLVAIGKRQRFFARCRHRASAGAMPGPERQYFSSEKASFS